METFKLKIFRLEERRRDYSVDLVSIDELHISVNTVDSRHIKPNSAIFESVFECIHIWFKQQQRVPVRIRVSSTFSNPKTGASTYTRSRWTGRTVLEPSASVGFICQEDTQMMAWGNIETTDRGAISFSSHHRLKSNSWVIILSQSDSFNPRVVGSSETSYVASQSWNISFPSIPRLNIYSFIFSGGRTIHVNKDCFSILINYLQVKLVTLSTVIFNFMRSERVRSSGWFILCVHDIVHMQIHMGTPAILFESNSTERGNSVIDCAGTGRISHMSFSIDSPLRGIMASCAPRVAVTWGPCVSSDSAHRLIVSPCVGVAFAEGIKLQIVFPFHSYVANPPLVAVQNVVSISRRTPRKYIRLRMLRTCASCY